MNDRRNTFIQVISFTKSLQDTIRLIQKKIKMHTDHIKSSDKSHAAQTSTKFSKIKPLFPKDILKSAAHVIKTASSFT